MESVVYFFYSKGSEFLEKYRQKIIDNFFDHLIKDADYLDAVRTSTGDKKRVNTRFGLAMSILGDV